MWASAGNASIKVSTFGLSIPVAAILASSGSSENGIHASPGISRKAQQMIMKH